ncbi:hypothetical protein BN000_05286 [Neobacillus massiliamazoniensis]|uniref:Uncharacterized protein n=1 Tax=Neobacillus massiliamazoniensis TaxID=1499688 RepID=A0A0U1P4C2_9BACI|nr:hypothetical protein BN000_05286 [Neobacillus massiliamazoniensis]
MYYVMASRAGKRTDSTSFSVLFYLIKRLIRSEGVGRKETDFLVG